MDVLLVTSTALVLVVLAVVGFGPAIVDRLRGRDETTRWRAVRRMPVYDPGRERRAERRARELMRSIVTDEEYAMYVELGFVRVMRPARDGEPDAYGYLVYPHRPIVAFDASTGELLSSTACASRTAASRHMASGSRTRTTCSPSGWRFTATSTP